MCGQLSVGLLEPVDNALMHPVQLADRGAGRIELLKIFAPAAFGEPDQECGSVWRDVAIGRTEGKVIIRHYTVEAQDHLGGASIGIESLLSYNVKSGEIQGAIMVAICGCPLQTTLLERDDQLVDRWCAIQQIGVRTCDQVPVQDHQLGFSSIENLVDHADGVDILLGTPLIPQI